MSCFCISRLPNSISVASRFFCSLAIKWQNFRSSSCLHEWTGFVAVDWTSVHIVVARHVFVTQFCIDQESNPRDSSDMMWHIWTCWLFEEMSKKISRLSEMTWWRRFFTDLVAPDGTARQLRTGNPRSRKVHSEDTPHDTLWLIANELRLLCARQ